MSVLNQVNVEVTKRGAEGDAGMFGMKFTYVEGKVKHQGNNVGTISATLVNRQAFADNDFHTTFDELSSDMEWIGCSLLENRAGRIRLESLLEWDYVEFDFMYITGFDVIGSSDIAAAALYHFLRDPSYIRGQQLPCREWSVCTAAYVLPRTTDRADNNGKRKYEDSGTHDPIEPFLRNGFFQDPALIREDPDNQRIVVATYGHWGKDSMPLSQQRVSGIPILSPPKKPTGKDKEILEAVETVCTIQHPQNENNVASMMIGKATFKPPQDRTTTEEMNSLKTTLTRLVREGGSLTKSTALHAAYEHNKPRIAKMILQHPNGIPAQLIASKNSLGQTPLMVAAKNAGGRISINGIQDTEAIDHLLAAGANKITTDAIGMTAYGYLLKLSKIMRDMTFHRDTIETLEGKLYPITGPTKVDLSGGKGQGTGTVDYGPEDDEADREMGRGEYANSDGDY